MKITTDQRGVHFGTLNVEDRGREFELPVYGRVEPGRAANEVNIVLSLDPADAKRIRTKS